MALDVSPASGVRSQVNITPLIDVVLVLLIIFMVMTPTQLKHLTTTLPPESPTAADLPPLTVTLSATGALVLNGETTDWQRLPDLLRPKLTRDRQRLVYFDIAEDADYGSAVRLMDLCRGAGAQVLALTPRSPT